MAGSFYEFVQLMWNNPGGEFGEKEYFKFSELVSGLINNKNDSNTKGDRTKFYDIYKGDDDKFEISLKNNIERIRKVNSMYESIYHSDDSLVCFIIFFFLFVILRLMHFFFKIVHPRSIKKVVSSHASQFAGFAQQDAQELLSFVLG
jgi:ubiquitin C-terminal hydrolase